MLERNRKYINKRFIYKQYCVEFFYKETLLYYFIEKILFFIGKSVKSIIYRRKKRLKKGDNTYLQTKWFRFKKKTDNEEIHVEKRRKKNNKKHLV